MFGEAQPSFLAKIFLQNTLLWCGGVSLHRADEIKLAVSNAVEEEARIMLDEGVVSEPQDIDLCMILGAGWPFWLGGITPYLDRSGISKTPFLAQCIASVPE